MECQLAVQSQKPADLDCSEQQIAQLEQGTRGFAFASGLAAIHAVLSIFKPGDRIVVGDNIYGGSYSQLNEFFTR